MNPMHKALNQALALTRTLMVSRMNSKRNPPSDNYKAALFVAIKAIDSLKGFH